MLEPEVVTCRPPLVRLVLGNYLQPHKNQGLEAIYPGVLVLTLKVEDARLAQETE